MKIYLHLKKHAKLIKIFCLVIALAILVGAGVIFRICYVMNACTDAIYQSPDALPSMETALLLGTA